MKSSTRRGAGAALAAVAALIITADAGAQPTAAAQDDAARIVTPPRRPPPPPRPPLDKGEAAIDWAAVADTIRQTRERDEAFERQFQTGVATRAIGPRPGGLRAFSPGQLPRIDAARVLETRLPMLVPLSADTIATLRVAARENAYTAIATLPDGAEVELLGTRLRVVGGGADIAKARLAERRRFQGRLPALDAPFLLSRHEEGVDLSFSKFGASYLITVRCPNVDTDERCTKDDYVRGLAENLGILNESAGDGQ